MNKAVTLFREIMNTRRLVLLADRFMKSYLLNVFLRERTAFGITIVLIPQMISDSCFLIMHRHHSYTGFNKYEARLICISAK